MLTYQQKIEKIIGALAYDIRGSWAYNTQSRVKIMIKLCEKINKNYWIKELEQDINYIIDDGRWMRDTWSGPYGPTNRKELNDDLYFEYEDVFECLESSFINDIDD